MSTVTAAHVTADELITTALARVDKALERLDEPMTIVQLHLLRTDLAVVKGMLLTKPLRPKGVG